MKTDKTIDRIKGCMLMEFACSSVCHLMALNFPDENELWNELARNEERHAEAIAKALGLEIQEYPEFVFPPGFDHVKKTIDYAERIKEKLLDKTSLREALEMAKKLQELKNDSYQSDLIEPEKEDRVKNLFRRLLEIDKTNLNVVQTVMDAYGLGAGG